MNTLTITVTRFSKEYDNDYLTTVDAEFPYMDANGRERTCMWSKYNPCTVNSKLSFNMDGLTIEVTDKSVKTTFKTDKSKARWIKKNDVLPTTITITEKYKVLAPTYSDGTARDDVSDSESDDDSVVLTLRQMMGRDPLPK